ncbi:MAG: tryptophan synthase subunit alpha [Candidatus Marinimicrobia bacterium]|nr:tryptophan synthase subunit alpha [Candidatus Neomarinimicrobiota bacterium]MDD5583264.1 tryptophan synthase subunit alpha [Candidatus Neomarinimicrobiota bacterium]
MNKTLHEVIARKKAVGDFLLSLYITAGYPHLKDTPQIILELDKAGVDFIELGIPFSDPLADGPVIQKASQIALNNGFRISHTFEILKEVRQQSSIPILLMSYLNPIYHYGIETFLNQAHIWGANGLIIPDLPLEERGLFTPFLDKYALDLIYLLPPNAPDERLHAIDDASTSFVYVVAYAGVTGRENSDPIHILPFLQTLKKSLTHPFLVGFGIHSHQDIAFYSRYADGVIIGSAFIKYLEKVTEKNIPKKTREFVHALTSPPA